MSKLATAPLKGEVAMEALTGDGLRQMREERGLKQVDIAKLVKMPVRTYQRYEDYAHRPLKFIDTLGFIKFFEMWDQVAAE